MSSSAARELTEEELAYLEGVSLPIEEKPETGPWPEGAREQMLEGVRVLLSRGVQSPSLLARILGVHYLTAKRWRDEVEEAWAKAYLRGEVNLRREKLYQEADAVAQLAWARALTTSSNRELTGLLKLVLQASERRAKLCGLDQQTVQIETKTKVEAQIGIDVVASVAEEFGLSPDALRAVGREAAIRISAVKLAEIQGATASPRRVLACTPDDQGVDTECTAPLDALEAENLEAAKAAQAEADAWKLTQESMEAARPTRSELETVGEWEDADE